MKVQKIIYNNRLYDGIELSFRDCSIMWAGYHSHILIVVMEQNWNWDKVIDYLIEEWKKESHYAKLQLYKKAPAPLVNKMCSMIQSFIVEKVMEFQGREAAQ